MREENNMWSDVSSKRRRRRDAEDEVNEASLSPPTDWHSGQAVW